MDTMDTLDIDTIEMFDVVALRDDDTAAGRRAGNQGTVLEFVGEGGAVAEVEFTDGLGRTLGIGYYHLNQLRRIWSYAEHRDEAAVKAAA